MENIEENNIKFYPKFVSLKGTETILDQMKEKVCKISIGNGIKGTGFFCKIPYFDDNQLLPVLITNNQIINESILNQENKKISLTVNNMGREIGLNNRIKYTNKKYDITIIEIKEKDGISNYLEVDNNLNDKNILEYTKESIYLLHYPQSEEVSVSYGVIKEVNSQNYYEFNHLCFVDTGSSGGPILNLSNNKVIGMHKATEKGKNFNTGLFLKNPISELINNKKNINFIRKTTKNYLDMNSNISEMLSSHSNQKMNYNINQINNSSFKPINIKLLNLGDTSYLNSVLYLLGNIKYFMDYFLKKSNVQCFTSNIKNLPLSFIMHRLFVHFYNNQGEKEYKPDSLKEFLGALNPDYESNDRRNPNELLNFILEYLHSELNKKTAGNKLNNDNNFDDKNFAIKYGINNYNSSNDSLISTLFNWFEIKESICRQCKRKILYNFYSFNTFELDILSIYKYKKHFTDNKNAVTLNECINFQQSNQNTKKIYCNICEQNTGFQSHSKIYSSPNMFIFLINRGNADKNLLNIPFIIEEKINLTFCIENQESIKNYELAGIVSINPQNNQYTSFCKSPIDNKWYFYKEEKNGQVELNQLLVIHNKNNNFIPFILLYNSIKNKQN